MAMGSSVPNKQTPIASLPRSDAFAGSGVVIVVVFMVVVSGQRRALAPATGGAPPLQDCGSLYPPASTQKG